MAEENIEEGRKPVFKYGRLSLVQTKKGMSYFGMHNEDYSTSQNKKIRLYRVKEILTENLNLAVIGVIKSIGEKIGILEALEIPRKEILNAATLADGPSQFFKDRNKITIPRNKIERIVEVPDYHQLYHAHNINLHELHKLVQSKE